jgi:hypothetical protein
MQADGLEVIRYIQYAFSSFFAQQFFCGQLERRFELFQVFKLYVQNGTLVDQQNRNLCKEKRCIVDVIFKDVCEIRPSQH